MLLGPWLMLGVCSLSVLRSCMSEYYYLFLCRVLMYGSETMIWREKERSRIRALQMDNLGGLLGIRRMKKVPNARIWQFFGVTKGVDEKTDEGVLRWFDHVERMENDRIAKRNYVGEYFGGRLVGKPRKRWIDTVEDCLKKKGLNVRQPRRMVHDRSVWRGFGKGMHGTFPWG